jgi:hypothetical protein
MIALSACTLCVLLIAFVVNATVILIKHLLDNEDVIELTHELISMMNVTADAAQI